MKCGRLIPCFFLMTLLACLAQPLSGQTPDKNREFLIEALRTGDGQAFGSYLNDLCDLELPRYKGTYSKAQAGRIVTEFFKDHPVSSFRIIREGELALKERYILSEMKSGTATYRIYFVLKEKEGKQVIPQVRIYQ